MASERKVSEQKALHAMTVLAQWRRQQEESEKDDDESVTTQIELRGIPLKLVKKMKELHPTRHKSWCVDKLLNELHEFREGKR